MNDLHGGKCPLSFSGLRRSAAVFCQPENHAPIIRWEHGQTKVV
ncbi:hypothetical protein NEISICOT_00185 [Neisseria sicca ATCC 29256]|uniref:Uncharacterized protein n=1 Tax=Neisseria sicca ATCC 29256 TaxID=547045 RepID=C6M109_NEISI|nr:hypothetical protein NEISICOT_00185 [Neisseria sicca ATCC 29256]